MPLTSHGVTDPGCVRTSNQDRILRDDELGLYIVCDGLGGRRRGDIAADMAIEAIRQYVESSINPKEVTWPYGYNLQLSYAANRLLTATKLANRQVWRRSEQSLEYLGMGTTIGAVLIDSGVAAVANIGDSRVYLFRDGGLQQLTIDDTVAAQGGLTGDVTGELTKAAGISVRNILTRAAGSEEMAESHLVECRLQDGDTLLLCSDGLHACVDDQRIREAMAASQHDIKETCSALVALARAVGAPDNVSVVVVRYGGAQPARA